MAETEPGQPVVPGVAKLRTELYRTLGPGHDENRPNGSIFVTPETPHAATSTV